MVSFLSPISKFSCIASRALRPRALLPAVFFSSITTLFDDTFKESREIVKNLLKEQGFTGILSTTSSIFNKNDLQALKVNFKPALKYGVLPCDIKDLEFDVESLKEISDNHIKAFLIDLHEVIKNLGYYESTEEAATETLITNLLVRVTDMHCYPLRVRTHPQCKLYISGEPYVSATPEFAVNRKNITMIVVEQDKQLKNTALIPSKCFGEAQLVAEMLASGSENMRQIARQNGVISDQIIFGIRAISSYFTFYETVIPAEY
ncbi:hypothetical protein C2G38_2150361 [Gigaspora rosea]|uniref:Uncharacterized protein n=1 Tax=Gigaspora rosea TaxID=44941 RepID=A0A397TXU3_9GLOM|nr:hypothetical protein C2G38_2150361 [Gigaspora rosea]